MAAPRPGDGTAQVPRENWPRRKARSHHRLYPLRKPRHAARLPTCRLRSPPRRRGRRMQSCAGALISLDTTAPVWQTLAVVSETQNQLTRAALSAWSRGKSNSLLPSPKPKINLFQAWLFFAVALGIGSSFTLAAATFSDANWTSLGGLPGANTIVRAAAGGDFTTAGGSTATYIAKWNGSSWSALGSGMNSNVTALAVSGSELYAGGF